MILTYLVVIGIGCYLLYEGLGLPFSFDWHWQLVEHSSNQIGRKKAKQPKWIPYSETKDKEYYCPNCGQPCSKEEYEHGYCLDCDQLELFDDFEEED